MSEHPISIAYHASTIEELLSVLPPEWSGIAARIIESGVELSPTICWWSPRWSPISPTIRKSKGIIDPTLHGHFLEVAQNNLNFETMMKSVIYRIHDCIHQLWGLPIHTEAFSEEEFYIYKRAVMCGEVAVLTLTEFAFVKSLCNRWPGMTDILDKRNALVMWRECFSHSNLVQIAQRLDGILHKKVRPHWLRNNAAATAFADDYVPMLEGDRAGCDRNWDKMKASNWIPHGAPNTRYNPKLDGLELTTWMIEDFNHLINTDPKIDEALRDFNRARRRTMTPPIGWGT